MISTHFIIIAFDVRLAFHSFVLFIYLFIHSLFSFILSFFLSFFIYLFI